RRRKRRRARAETHGVMKNTGAQLRLTIMNVRRSRRSTRVSVIRWAHDVAVTGAGLLGAEAGIAEGTAVGFGGGGPIGAAAGAILGGIVDGVGGSYVGEAVGGGLVRRAFAGRRW